MDKFNEKKETSIESGIVQPSLNSHEQQLLELKDLTHVLINKPEVCLK